MVTADLDVPDDHGQPELLVYLQTESKIAYAGQAVVNGRDVEVILRSRSRRGRDEAWFFIPMAPGRNDVKLTLAGGDQAVRIGVWLRSRVLGRAENRRARFTEPLMPVLPPDYRQQYWPVIDMHGMKR